MRFLVVFFIIMQALGSDFQSPRTAALGGAGSAGPLLNDAIYLNPAFASFLPTYSLSGSFLKFSGDGIHGTDGIDHAHYGRLYNISLQDGRSEMFQAGAGMTVREEGRFVHIGASRRAMEKAGFGLGVKLFFPSGGGARSFAKDLTLSSAIVLTEWVQLSLIVDNLFQMEWTKEIGWYREIKIGSKFNIMQILLAYVDPHFTPALNGAQRFGHEIGLELAPFSDIFMRMGHFRNALIPFEGQHGYGIAFGLGWVGPRFSVDFAFQRPFETVLGRPKSSAWTIGMSLFF